MDLLRHVGILRKWTQLLSKNPSGERKYPCLVDGVTIMMKKKIMYGTSRVFGDGYIDVEKNIAVLNDILHGLYTENNEVKLYLYYRKFLIQFEKRKH